MAVTPLRRDMSEGSQPGRDQVWIEKYRPERLADVVGQDRIIERLEGYVEQGEVPHLLFAGPAGVGKCTTGETPILTTEGVRRIEDVVGDVDGFGTPPTDLEVATLSEEGEFTFVEPSHVFSKRTDRIAAIETRAGGTHSVTPEHRLLVIDEDGLDWRPAAALEAGDRIARPMTTPTPTVEESLTWLEELDGDRFQVVVDQAFGTAHDLPATERTGATTSTGVTVPLTALQQLSVPSTAVVDHVQGLRSVDDTAAWITVPEAVTPALAEFLAWVVSDASVDGGHIRFATDATRIADRFERLATDLFDVESERLDGSVVRIESPTLTEFLTSGVGVLAPDAIGATLVSAPEPARRAFLRTVFDAAGTVSADGVVEVTQDADLVTLLAYLLTSVGIPSQQHPAAADGVTTLSIAGPRQLTRFRDRVGFSVEAKAERLADATATAGTSTPDTIPVQAVVGDLCAALGLDPSEHLPDTGDPEPPDRVTYLEGLDSVLAAATDQLARGQMADQPVPTAPGIRGDGRDGRGPAAPVGGVDDRPGSGSTHRLSAAATRPDTDTGGVDATHRAARDAVGVADEGHSRTVQEVIAVLDALATGSLYFDEVRAVDVHATDERVYDVTVPDSHNYVAGEVPTVMHNTASAQAIARELYGEDWRENFLELNASDDRGIDVVRERIKEFARASFGGYAHRMIFLDEADALTDDAQSALRRTMEQFSDNVRFVLSCNYSSQIIDPIQSRCAVFRFSSLPDDAVEEVVRKIADTEGIDITDAAVDALVYAADGDMRKAINGLQAASVTGGTVEEEMVYEITATARPEEVQAMVEAALDGEFAAARAKLDELLTGQGLAGGDIIDQLHRSVWEFDIPDDEAVYLMDRVGEADYRIAEGANERVQLEALLAAVALRQTAEADR